jgi:hypothetical protein
VSDIIYQNQENLANSTKGGFPVKGGKGNEGGNKEGREKGEGDKETILQTITNSLYLLGLPVTRTQSLKDLTKILK